MQIEFVNVSVGIPGRVKHLWNKYVWFDVAGDVLAPASYSFWLSEDRSFSQPMSRKFPILSMELHAFLQIITTTDISFPFT